jgi:hypothetical protein
MIHDPQRSPGGDDADSLASLLFGTDEPVDDGGRRTVSFGAGLRAMDFIPVTAIANLSPDARQLVGDQITAVANDLFDLNLGHLVMTAWRTHSALRDAAHATLADQGTQRVVDLATHRVKSEQAPHVDVLVNSTTVARIELKLTLELLITTVAVEVRHGRLTALQCGQATVTAALSIAGVEVIRGEHPIDLHAAVRLGDGIPILPDHETTSPERGAIYTSRRYPIVANAQVVHSER